MEDRALRQHATGDVSLQLLELQQGPDIPVRVALAYIARGVLDPAVAKVLFHVVGHIYGANPAL